MEEAKDYKKYLKGLKDATSRKGPKNIKMRKIMGLAGMKLGNIQGLLAGRSALKKRTGGAMLKNPGKADLNKDGKLSGYEKKRGMAIEKSMSGKRFGGVMKRSKGGGADTGKVGEMKSKVGVTMNKLKRRIKGTVSRPEMKFIRKMVPGVATKMGGGMMKKYSVGGNVLHKLKSQKELKKITSSDAYKKADYKGKTQMLGGKATSGKDMQKKMGGGMMMKPMGYKKGTSVMARGCKLGRKKATKIT
jgi:hypothetical protein